MPCTSKQAAVQAQTDAPLQTEPAPHSESDQQPPSAGAGTHFPSVPPNGVACPAAHTSVAPHWSFAVQHLPGSVHLPGESGTPHCAPHGQIVAPAQPEPAGQLASVQQTDNELR